MNEIEMSRYITEVFAGVDVVVEAGNSFFFYNPDPTLPPDHMFPWITLMTNDVNDQFSNLDRPAVYRLNIGISKVTFQALLGPGKQLAESDGAEPGEEALGGYDFTAPDRVMPHPVYGKMHWVCVLNPSDETLQATVRPLMDEAYAIAVTRYKKRR